MSSSAQSIAFCTVATESFLPQALVAFQSVRQHYGAEVALFLLAIGPISDVRADIEVLASDDLLGQARFDMMARYSIREFSWACKAPLMAAVQERGFESVIYIDSDTELFGRLKEVELLLEGDASIVLSAHALEPHGLGQPASDRSLVVSGPFNSGFLAVRSNDVGRRFVDWWAMVKRTECYCDAAAGHMNGDQQWLSLVPAYFEGCVLVRHAGYNVGHFNIRERLDLLGSADLRLFHYASLHQLDWNVGRYLDQIDLPPTEGRTLFAFLRSYVERVLAAAKALGAGALPGPSADIPGYPRLSDTSRRVYRHLHPTPSITSERDLLSSVRALQEEEYAQNIPSDGDAAFLRAATLAAELNEVRQSRSWRMTAPLRALKAAITGGS